MKTETHLFMRVLASVDMVTPRKMAHPLRGPARHLAAFGETIVRRQGGAPVNRSSLPATFYAHRGHGPRASSGRADLGIYKCRREDEPTAGPVALFTIKFSKKMPGSARPRSYEQVCVLIAMALDLFTADECANYARHCGYRVATS